MKIITNEVGVRGYLIENDGYIASMVDDEHNRRLLEQFKEDAAAIPNPFYIHAVITKADTENKNGRVYPFEILKREMDKYARLIPHLSGAEYNHPDSSVIDLERMSHKIVDMSWEGKVLIGKLQIFTTRGFRNMGIISCVGDDAAHKILECGMTLGISTRGVGSLERRGNVNVVKDDFEFICADLVSTPSSPGSYLFTDKSQLQTLPESHQKSKSLIIGLDDFLKK